MFQNFPNVQNCQISKFLNFKISKKYSDIRGATSISDAFYSNSSFLMRLGTIRKHSQKSTLQKNATMEWIFFLFKAFFWHGPINVHARAYMDEPSHLAKFSSVNTLFPNFNILTQELRKLMKTEKFWKRFHSQFLVFVCWEFHVPR